MTLRPPSIRLLVCGTAERGDDGAALAAVAHLLPTLQPEICERLEVRLTSELATIDFIDLGPGAACLIVDTATGVAPGGIVTLALDELGTGAVPVIPRSARGQAIDEVMRDTGAARGSLPDGAFVGIGGKWFGYGSRFSRAVTAGLPSLQAAILAELVRLAQPDPLPSAAGA